MQHQRPKAQVVEQYHESRDDPACVELEIQSYFLSERTILISVKNVIRTGKLIVVVTL